ncbi:MAG: DMT family transporter [Roseovarius sp.]|nr:DMT family transporter [Roseovarius sp.]
MVPQPHDPLGTGLPMPLLAVIFVLLWSSAFVATRAGLPDVSPLLFLTLRFTLAAAVLWFILCMTGFRWRSLRDSWRDLALVGALSNGLYLSGAYLAMTGINAATMALIGALHPVVTALLAGPVLHERMTPRQWAGLALGLLGVGLAVGGDVSAPSGLIAPLLGLAGIVALAWGSIHQRRTCRHVPVLPANAVQLASGALVALVLTGATEVPHADWTSAALATLAYLALVVSLGAPVLMMLMLREREAGRAASVFHLMPGTTAVMGWLLLGEHLSGAALAGLGVASLGVWLGLRSA